MTLPNFRGEIETILSKLQIEKHIAGARINPSYDVAICNSANKASVVPKRIIRQKNVDDISLDLFSDPEPDKTPVS